MANKVASSKKQKPQSRGVVLMASARAVIPTAPNCICPTCSANDWEDTDPDDTTPPALAYKCKQCGVRHVPVVGAGGAGIANFWVLRLVSANNLDVSGTNYRRVEVEFEDLITGATDSLATASQLGKAAIGTLSDGIDFNGVSAPNTILFQETGTGNSNIASFNIGFISVTGIKVTSTLVVGFKNGETAIMMSEPNIVSKSGNDIEISSLANRALVNGSNVDTIGAIIGYSYNYSPDATNSAILAQSLTQGSTPGSHTYAATTTMANVNKLNLVTGDTVFVTSQAVVIVVP